MGTTSRSWIVGATIAVIGGVTLGAAWKLSRNDGVARAAGRADESRTLPKLAPEEQAPPPRQVAETEVELTSEQRRLRRYDKDADGSVGKDEYLISRRKAFAKLDSNGDGTLQFDEYATKTVDKFNKADGNRDGSLSSDEFATTAVKRTLRKTVECPPDDRREE
jgi:hypothetical protein